MRRTLLRASGANGLQRSTFSLQTVLGICLLNADALFEFAGLAIPEPKPGSWLPEPCL
jgi:hypothetical protein